MTFRAETAMVKVRWDRKKKKVKVVVTLLAALILQAAVAVLTPLAKEYGWEQFVTAPMLLLRYVLRPFATTLLGWAVVEAGRELAGIRIWDKKTEKTRKTVGIVHTVLVGCLAVAAVLTVCLGVETACQWYLSGKMLREQGFFDSSGVPYLTPGWLYFLILYFYVICLDDMGIFGGVCFFFGAALAFCRIEKRESGKEAKHRTGQGEEK